jgi:hypothetical protein
MKKINKYDKKYIFLLIFILFICIILCYFSYKYITKNKIYIGCLYAKTGILGNESYNNYLILKDSLNYACQKFKLNLEFIFLYKDLGDNLNNYYNWMEECIKKYNTKYFFGCWRSSERKILIPLLIKYNVRLFYAVQYEGYECMSHINYFGGTPNQQLIPGLKYIFSKFDYYKDVYIIGNKYIYPITTTKIITNFIKNNKLYNMKIKDIYLFDDKNYNFIPFINKIFKKSNNGAIIINLINGNINDIFFKTFYNLFYEKNSPLDKKYYYDNNLFIKNIKNINESAFERIYNKYPIISFSISENTFMKNHLKYYMNSFYSVNFTNNILREPIYQLLSGVKEAKEDLLFLNKYQNKNNINIDDAQYGTFLSALFFIKTINILINKNLDFYNPNIYDNNKYIELSSVGGVHIFNSNNNISKNFFITQIDKNDIYKIIYFNYMGIAPQNFIETGIDYDIFCNATEKNPILYTRKFNIDK